MVIGQTEHFIFFTSICLEDGSSADKTNNTWMMMLNEAFILKRGIVR
jgi:hypothetical protein